MSLDLYRAGSVPTSGRKNTDRTVCIPRREAGRAGVMSLDLYRAGSVPTSGQADRWRQ